MTMHSVQHHVSSSEATPRKVLCQYSEPGRDGMLDLCTGEAADPRGEIFLCTRHLGDAMRLINRRINTLRAARGGAR